MSINSRFFDKLFCPHCGKGNQEPREWCTNGDWVAFYFQKEPGRYNAKVYCPFCDKEWYVVWDEEPGQLVKLQ